VAAKGESGQPLWGGTVAAIEVISRQELC